MLLHALCISSALEYIPFLTKGLQNFLTLHRTGDKERGLSPFPDAPSHTPDLRTTTNTAMSASLSDNPSCAYAYIELSAMSLFLPRSQAVI